jgi:hypothetical protein
MNQRPDSWFFHDYLFRDCFRHEDSDTRVRDLATTRESVNLEGANCGAVGESFTASRGTPAYAILTPWHRICQTRRAHFRLGCVHGYRHELGEPVLAEHGAGAVRVLAGNVGQPTRVGSSCAWW